MSQAIWTPEFRGNWPALLKPAKKDLKKADSELEFRVDAVFALPKTDPAFDELRALAVEAFKTTFPHLATMPDGFFTPFRDQAEKADDKGVLPVDYVAGNMFMRYKAKADRRPDVVDEQGNPILDPSKIVSGMWMSAIVHAYGFNNKEKGVTFGLDGIMVFTKKPYTPWDNRPDTKAMFKARAQTGGAGAGTSAAVSKLFG